MFGSAVTGDPIQRAPWQIPLNSASSLLILRGLAALCESKRFAIGALLQDRQKVADMIGHDAVDAEIQVRAHRGLGIQRPAVHEREGLLGVAELDRAPDGLFHRTAREVWQ